MFHWFAHGFSTYILHCTVGPGYAWWSGPGSDLGEASIMVTLITIMLHHNCHQPGCLSLRTHKHPEHGWPACKRHWNIKPEHVD